jgi:hypothetical protein
VTCKASEPFDNFRCDPCFNSIIELVKGPSVLRSHKTQIYGFASGRDLLEDSKARVNQSEKRSSSGSSSDRGRSGKGAFFSTAKNPTSQSLFLYSVQQSGAIRQLYTACKHRGFVMISYYDIRAARSAMRALQNKPLRRRKLDIHFSIPKVGSRLIRPTFCLCCVKTANARL